MVQAKDITDIMQMDDVHKIYFNEFGLGISQNDVFIVLRRNGREEAVINTSHITAKAFAGALEHLIRNYERKTNQTILISDDIEKSTEEISDADEKQPH